MSDSPRAFNCPACGASLEAPNASTVVCQYCNTRVTVPAELRQKARPDPQALAQALAQQLQDTPTVTTIHVSPQAAGRVEAFVAIFMAAIGLLVIANSGNIDILTTGGRFVRRIPGDYTLGYLWAVAIDREGFIYGLTNAGQVLKYQLNEALPGAQ